jgi:flagellar biosynthesis/type III secretory pathway chaperone
MTAHETDLLERLAEEQQALEHLLFKLREQHFVLTSGEHRWLGPCTAEVEEAVHRLTASGRRREAAAAAVHASQGLPSGTTLGELATRVADELTCQRLLQRRRSLADVLDQVRRCSRQNREILAQGLAVTSDALALLGTAPTYNAAGAVASARPRAFDARI